MRGFRNLWLVILLGCWSTTGAAWEWECIGDLSSAIAVGNLTSDPTHDRLLLGTIRGYRVYYPESGDWLIREPGNSMGNYHAICFLTSDTDSLALLTGRSEANWYGYIMNNNGLTELGPIVSAGWDLPPEQGAYGAVTGIGRTPGPPEALLACTEFWSLSGFILRSLDEGWSWDLVRYLPETCGYALSVAPSGDVLVGYGVQGAPTAPHGLLRSVDSGTTWEDATGDLSCVAYIGDVRIDPANSQHMYVRQGGYMEDEDPRLGVYETQDGGQHWTQVFQGNALDLCMHPYDASILALVEPWAIMLTSDGGSTWEEINGDLPYAPGSETCAISPTDERLYIASDEHGMWACALDPTAVEDIAGAGISLRVHPNPCNPLASLTFEVPREAQVRLSVVDIVGRSVRTLLRGAATPAGQQSLIWDGRDEGGRPLPSGLYFAHLQVGDKRVSRKLILLR